MGFWDNVEILLKKRGRLSYGWKKELANKASMTYRTLVHQYENKSDPKARDAVKIARVLGTTVEALLSENTQEAHMPTGAHHTKPSVVKGGGKQDSAHPGLVVVEPDPTYDPRKHVKVPEHYYTDGSVQAVVRFMGELSKSTRMSLSIMSEALANTQPTVASRIAHSASDNAENARIVHPRVDVTEETSRA